MRKPHKAREQLTQNICPRCGKTFCPAPYHVYEDKWGAYCSWTCFNHRDEVNKTKIRLKGRPSRPVEQLTLDGESVAIFRTAELAAEAIDAVSSSIRKACNTYPKPFKKYLWRFKTEGDT